MIILYVHGWFRENVRRLDVRNLMTHSDRPLKLHALTRQTTDAVDLYPVTTSAIIVSIDGHPMFCNTRHLNSSYIGENKHSQTTAIQ